MSMKHKEIAIKWLQGASVQIQLNGNNWVDLQNVSKAAILYRFDNVSNYRLKPVEEYRYVRCRRTETLETVFDTVFREPQDHNNLKLTFVDSVLTKAEVI